MIERLKQRFDSLLKVFEIIYIIENTKPAARMMVFEDEYNSTRSFLKELNLYIGRSDFKVSKIDSSPYSNKGEIIKGKEKGYYFAYISKNKDVIKRLKQYEKDKDHINLGLSLGYPKCCCEFFDKQHKTQEKRFNDYILPALENSKGFIFPFYNNVASRYFDLALLSHFPCNFDCKHSIDIAKNNLKVIEKNSEEYSAILRGMLKGGIIYTENYGVFLLRNAKIRDNMIYYESVMGSQNNKMSVLLKSNSQIKIIDKNHIKVEKQDIHTKNIGFMYFI
ncbi:MAG: hypothetical protein ABIJ08_03495 [Nanoarchaeota archaeon]